MLADIHYIIGVTVRQHAGGNGGGGMFAVGEYADFWGTLHQGAVQFLPRASGQGDGAHVVVGHYKAVGQGLQRVEGGVEEDFGIGQFPPHRVGKAEEQGVTGGKDNDRNVLSGSRFPEDYLHIFLSRKDFLVLPEYLVQRYGDGNPFRVCGQQAFHYLPVPHAAREHLAPAYVLHDFRREERFPSVIHSYDNKFSFH